MRKIISAFLCVALIAVSLYSCGGAVWCVKYGNNTVAPKVFDYYACEVYRPLLGSGQITADAPLSEQKIGDVSAKKYIYDNALDRVLYLCELTERFRAAGLMIDGEMLKSLKTAAANEYQSRKELFDKMGVDEDIIFEAGTSGKLGYMQQALFNSIYSTDGTNAVADEELNAFFTQNYISYSYIYRTLLDAEGNPLDNASKSAVKKELTDIADGVKAGTVNIDDVASAYALEYQQDNNCGKNGIPTTTSVAGDTEITRRVRELAAGQTVYLEIGNYAFVVQRHDLADTQYVDANRYGILVEMKIDEFTGEIMQAAREKECTKNEKYMKSVISELNK